MYKLAKDAPVLDCPHHPSAPDLSVAGGCYNFTGHSQPDVQYKANAVKTSAKGYRSIWFRNGNTTIDIAYPAYYMRGEHVCHSR